MSLTRIRPTDLCLRSKCLRRWVLQTTLPKGSLRTLPRPKLAPIIRDIYKQSLREGYILSLLKSSIVSPLPKVTPARAVESDLRPISLTCTLVKVMHMEGFTCRRLNIQLLDK